MRQETFTTHGTTLTKVNKRAARKLFEEGKPFYIVGDNVNSYHIIGGWGLGYRCNPQQAKDHDYGNTFDDVVRNFEYYLVNSVICRESEVGRRAAYYRIDREEQNG